MFDLDQFQSLGTIERGLVVVSTTRGDGTVQASVVNAGVMNHPVDGDNVVAFVAAGGTVKLAHLRSRPAITVVVRSGWEWAAVEGEADLVGPDDQRESVEPQAVPGLLREIFVAAGGTHDDWEEYDRVMAEERRTAVLVRPTRVYSNRRR